jgi:putative two-component system response regulator
MSPPRVLAVDDQPENRELLGAILDEEGFEVDFACDGVEALEAVGRQLPHAILLDLMMPRMDGLEVCRRLKSTRPTCFVPVLLLTALSDVESKVRGLDAGADDFLNKPFHRAELLTRLRSLLRIRALRDELDSTESVIFSMIDLLEGKDPRTRHHSLRVAALAGAAAERLSLGARARHDVVWAGLLHDLGKIGVPESILLTPPAKRSDEDEARYRDHPLLGCRILEPIASFGRALELVARHHERLDGSGYPRGLAGPLLDRPGELVAVADRYDDLRREQPASNGWNAALRAEATAGLFRAETVEAVIAAASGLAGDPSLDAVLPVPVPEAGGTILVADDSATNRALYRELLENAGFRTLLCDSGAAALELLEKSRPDLLLLDVRMPDVPGDEVCWRIKSRPDAVWLPVVLVTAYEERESRRRALDARADDLLLAPIHRTELVARVRSLLRLRIFHDDLVGHENVVLSLSAALEAKDPYTRGHSTRVGALSARLARELGEPESAAEQLRIGGLLHDIGKVALPESVLHKPGRLTPEEFSIVMSHPTIGWEICRRLRTAAPVLDVIRLHHERFDGSGYPDGLAGEAIPWPVRILSLADALDALTSERPYRHKLAVADAMELLHQETTIGRWDPKVYAALDRLHLQGIADPRGAALSA